MRSNNCSSTGKDTGRPAHRRCCIGASSDDSDPLVPLLVDCHWNRVQRCKASSVPSLQPTVDQGLSRAPMLVGHTSARRLALCRASPVLEGLSLPLPGQLFARKPRTAQNEISSPAGNQGGSERNWGPFAVETLDGWTANADRLHAQHQSVDTCVTCMHEGCSVNHKRMESAMKLRGGV